MLLKAEDTYTESLKNIQDIAEIAGIDSDHLEMYGKYKAKVNLSFYEKVKSNPKGKLIYVTCITPTPAGEGKTLTSIGLAQAMGKLEKKTMLCLREPSLGPVFGKKGGASGGGKSQIHPMEDINLHFTGDLHAISSAHNLLAAILDNHLFRGNEFGFDLQKARWRRVMDMNDRALRELHPDGFSDVYGKTGFDITASSEIMAIMALASNLEDLKNRLSRIIVGYNYSGKPIMADELGVIDSMTLLLKEAIKPNLVQTSEGQPVFIHCGPFANIAHGNSSVIATKMALNMADYVITEGGFSTDLGAEKFFDIVCPKHNLKPDVAILVCSARALKMHGGADRKEYTLKNTAYLENGLNHLKTHISIIAKFGLPVVVAINKFAEDNAEELQIIESFCNSIGARVAISDVFANGGEGGISLAEEILESLSSDENNFKPIYEQNTSITNKIDIIAKEIYGADAVEFDESANEDLELLLNSGLGELPICMAKTQFSLSDNSKLKGVPKDWILKIRHIKPSNGAGFVVPVSGNVMLMPGLPKYPSANNIKIDNFGNVTGLR